MSDNTERIGYKFSNILDLSVTKDLTSLPEEWECVDYRSESSTQCICSRWIKHAYYYLNRINGNTIRVGSGCVKKLELPKKGEGRHSNPILLRFIQQWRGEYTNINDLLKYSEESRNDILDIIEETIKNVPISKKEELLVQVREMHDIFHKNGIDCKRIQDICHRLLLEIRRHNEHLEWLRIQEEKQKVKATLDAAEYREKQLAAMAKFREEEKERQKKEEERKRLENIDRENEIKKHEEAIRECVCGISRANICVCEVPRFELWKLNKQFACTKCKKWKDRCN